MFPPDAWPDESGKSSPRVEVSNEDWFGKPLRAMKDKDLWSAPPPPNTRRIVRLTLLPTWEPAATMRLFENHNGGLRFTFKQLNGSGGYAPGRLVNTAEGHAPAADARRIAELLNRHAPTWSDLPSTLAKPEIVCTDGTIVVLELSDADAYKVIARHECNLPEGAPLRDLVSLLDNLSGGLLVAPMTF